MFGHTFICTLQNISVIRATFKINYFFVKTTPLKMLRSPPPLLQLGNGRAQEMFAFLRSGALLV